MIKNAHVIAASKKYSALRDLIAAAQKTSALIAVAQTIAAAQVHRSCSNAPQQLKKNDQKNEKNEKCSYGGPCEGICECRKCET